MSTPSHQTTSRREFLRTSTTAALGATLAAPFVATRTDGAAADTLKVGLIGCGGRGAGAASQALKADNNAVLTAMADVFDDPLRSSLGSLKNDASIKDRVQVKPDQCFVGLDGYQKVIDSGVDVVLLATPPGFRPMHLKAAVAAGKHIFTEKPMATDAPGVRSVMESVAQAKQKKLAVVAGFCWRYDFARREFYKRILDGAIGEINSIYATYYTGPVKPMPPANTRKPGTTDVEWQLRNWYNFVWLCGDGLVEQACHSIDKIAWAMRDEPPVKAVATGGRQTPNHEGNIYDHMHVVYEYANGMRAFMGQRQISNCYSQNADFLTGTQGTAAIAGSAPTIKGRSPWRFSGKANDMYQTEHDEFFASVRSGNPINDGDWMAKSTLMAILGRTAAYTGQEVTWEQALNSEEKLVPDQFSWHMTLPIAPMAIPGKTKLV